MVLGPDEKKATEQTENFTASLPPQWKFVLTSRHCYCFVNDSL